MCTFEVLSQKRLCLKYIKQVFRSLKNPSVGETSFSIFSAQQQTPYEEAPVPPADQNRVGRRDGAGPMQGARPDVGRRPAGRAAHHHVLHWQAHKASPITLLHRSLLRFGPNQSLPLNISFRSLSVNLLCAVTFRVLPLLLSSLSVCHFGKLKPHFPT